MTKDIKMHIALTVALKFKNTDNLRTLEKLYVKFRSVKVRLNAIKLLKLTMSEGK